MRSPLTGFGWLVLLAVVAGALTVGYGFFSTVAANTQQTTSETAPGQGETMMVWDALEKRMVESQKVEKTDEQWRALLAPEVYHVTREEGTEGPWTGEYNDHKGDGIYICAACGLHLYDSATKFDSGTGWPSYYESVHKNNVGENVDKRFFMVRTEVHCARCGSHLGHVFPDGPKPTGLRHCINSVALKFTPR